MSNPSWLGAPTLTPPLRDRLEAFAVIFVCLALFGLSAYLCHVWRNPVRVGVHAPWSLDALDEAAEEDIVRGWGERRDSCPSGPGPQRGSHSARHP